MLKNKKQKEFLNIIKTDGDKIKFEAQKQFVKQTIILIIFSGLLMSE